MNLNPFDKLNRLYTWWVTSLLSCLPEKWLKYLSHLKSNFDLIITHKDDSLIIMTDHGKILDSIPLAGNVGIDLEKLPAEVRIEDGFSDSEMIVAELVMPLSDPPMSLATDSVDIGLDGQKEDLSVEALDLVLGDDTQEGGDTEYDIKLSDHVSNVIPLDFPLGNEAPIILDKEDKTTRLLAIDPESDEDTMIIQDDQGNLLQFNPVSKEHSESTVLFRSEGGKIRQVGLDDLGSDNSTSRDENWKLPFKNTPDTGDSNEYSMVATLLEIYQSNKICLYFLPESKVFTLNLSYPIEAIENIESVLKYDLEKHIPLSAHEIRYFYALNVHSIQNKVDAEVVVIKSEEFNPLSLALEPFVKRGLVCTTENFFRKYGKRINFLEQNQIKSWRSILKAPNLHLAFNWVLILLLLAVPFFAFYQGIENIEKKSPEEIRRVSELVASFNSTNVETRFGSKLSEQISKAPRSVELLSTLSDNINSQAWLNRFTLKNNEIKIRGEAESATSVSDDLDRTGLFESIKFISSIVKNHKTGKEAFELLLVLKPDA